MCHLGSRYIKHRRLKNQPLDWVVKDPILKICKYPKLGFT